MTNRTSIWATTGALAACLTLGACAFSGVDELGGGVGQNGNGKGDDPVTKPVKVHTALDDRVVDYNEALRTASLKLLRTLPTLDQINALARATNKKKAYQAALATMLDDPRFGERMIKFWKDTMRQGGGGTDTAPSRDTAPTFAAQLVVEGRPFTELFTAASGNCPTYDGDAKVFVAGDCGSGAPAESGVLTNPGTMHQFFGHLAFRRVRWLQEVFVCTKFPAEYADTPVEKNGAEYVSPWPFESVSKAPIDFQDTKSVICANCHTTINHIAPLLANLDANGMWHDTIQVETPQTPNPIPSELSHWLRSGETMSWRLGEPVADLTDLGEAMAADPDVHECAVARFWNFTMSKEDIVSDLSTVPVQVLQPYIDAFESNGMNLKELLRTMMSSEDFVSF